ncbi:hypothetical protein JXM67_15260 [candidate division WOR-3 bacterium]|nr:hypothetical protein [candidate division WOR-3 bacterium]
MKSKLTAAVCGIIAVSSLYVSYQPSPADRVLPYLGNYKVVCVYALGQWNDSGHTVEHQQNTPLEKTIYMNVSIDKELILCIL